MLRADIFVAMMPLRHVALLLIKRAADAMLSATPDSACAAALPAATMPALLRAARHAMLMLMPLRHAELITRTSTARPRRCHGAARYAYGIMRATPLIFTLSVADSCLRAATLLPCLRFLQIHVIIRLYAPICYGATARCLRQDV